MANTDNLSDNAAILANRAIAMANKATPGPWTEETEESSKVRAPHGGYVAIIGWLKGRHGEKGRIPADEGVNNAEFIAFAREALPELAYAVLRQRQVDEDNARLRTEIADLRARLNECGTSKFELFHDNQRLRAELSELKGKAR